MYAASYVASYVAFCEERSTAGLYQVTSAWQAIATRYYDFGY